MTQFFKNFCGMKGAHRYMKILLLVFSEKKNNLGQFSLFRSFLLFDWAWSKLSQAIVIIGSLNSWDMIRILKQSRHDFLGKHLCDGYCMDIIL